MWKLILAQAKEAAPESAPAENGAGAGGGFSFLPLLIAVFAIMYFLMIRPQQKREKERREMLSALGKGDRVVTTGGICGTIVNLSEDNVILRVDDNVTMEFVRGAIAQVTGGKGESNNDEQ